MLKIARFEKQFRYASGATAKSSDCKPPEIDNPNSEAQLTGRSEQLISRRMVFLGL
jgi:hypothetical protein